MDKEQIISTLINLNFSRLEAEIYITLLGGEMSGYQISKKIWKHIIALLKMNEDYIMKEELDSID